jgi:hypothetical protein
MPDKQLRGAVNRVSRAIGREGDYALTDVSQDGRFYMFTSNWEETLGRDHDHFREDVFIVRRDRDR